MSDKIQAVLFDLDGVLVHSPLDLPAIKRELFGDSSVFIIEGIEALPEHEREEKRRILLKRELEAASEATLAPGAVELFSWLELRSIKRGIITRNCREAVNMIIKKTGVDFGAVVARDDAPPKPDPEAVFAACRILGVDPKACVMVGDYTFDIQAGKNAGCRTIFIETDKFRHLDPGSDARIKSLEELAGILEKWLDE